MTSTLSAFAFSDKLIAAAELDETSNAQIRTSAAACGSTESKID
jgi:hypothetical protein